MDKGKNCGQFLVEEVDRAYDGVCGLFRGRYEGTYEKGRLSVVSTSLFQHWKGRPDALVSALLEHKPLCSPVVTQLEADESGGNAEIETIFPAYVTVIQDDSDLPSLAGFFPEKVCDDYAGGQSVSLGPQDLKDIAEVLDNFHHAGHAHGALRPELIRRCGSRIMIGCPFFPLFPEQLAIGWFCDMGNDRALRDRQVLALLVADRLQNRDSCEPGFDGRVTHWKSYVEFMPKAVEFVEGRGGISCKEFVNKAFDGDVSEGLDKKSGRPGKNLRRAVALVLAILAVASVFLWLLHGSK